MFKFKDLKSAYVRVVNDENRKEILRYEIDRSVADETALIFCEVYRNQNRWKFKAVGQGFNGGLQKLCGNFGVATS
jgi:tellurium resistance protein TerD